MVIARTQRVLRLALLGSLCLLSACAGSVWTTVSTYRADAGLPQKATIRIMPLVQINKVDDIDDGDAKNQPFDKLEFNYFAGRLGERFAKAGLSPTASEAADLTVYLAYDVSRQEKSDSRPVSMYGHLGYYYRYGSVIVVDDVDRDRYEFLRKVKVSVLQSGDADESEPLLSLTAVSKGGCGHLASVYEEMLDAIFSNLNRPNGSVIKLKSKRLGPCEVRG